MVGNHIFLLLNNAGPYTGGYTRVIYAFSSGSCLIAHKRLADSMPELVHDRNCLLGATPERSPITLPPRHATHPARAARRGRARHLRAGLPPRASAAACAIWSLEADGGRAVMVGIDKDLIELVR